MARVIQARLDKETDELRRRLNRRLGWNDSRIVREGIKSLAALVAPSAKRRIVGLGQFASGVPDLGSNDRHLEGFGR